MSTEPFTADLVTLAVEHWRLGVWLAGVRGTSTTLAQRSLRQIADVLTRWEVEAQHLDGRPFDAGLAARVVDTFDDPATPAGRETVDETLSPIVLVRGKVVKPAEIVVRRGTA